MPNMLQQSCGSGVLADGRLGDLIRRVATFGMILMKLDLRQVRSGPFFVTSLFLKLLTYRIHFVCN